MLSQCLLCSSKKCASVLGKDREGIFGGVDLPRPRCWVLHGAEARFVMDLQWLQEGGVEDQEKNKYTQVCVFSGEAAFVLTQKGFV